MAQFVIEDTQWKPSKTLAEAKHIAACTTPKTAQESSYDPPPPPAKRRRYMALNCKFYADEDEELDLQRFAQALNADIAVDMIELAEIHELTAKIAHCSVIAQPVNRPGEAHDQKDADDNCTITCINAIERGAEQHQRASSRIVMQYIHVTGYVTHKDPLSATKPGSPLWSIALILDKRVKGKPLTSKDDFRMMRGSRMFETLWMTTGQFLDKDHAMRLDVIPFTMNVTLDNRTVIFKNDDALHQTLTGNTAYIIAWANGAGVRISYDVRVTFIG